MPGWPLPRGVSNRACASRPNQPLTRTGLSVRRSRLRPPGVRRAAPLGRTARCQHPGLWTNDKSTWHDGFPGHMTWRGRTVHAGQRWWARAPSAPEGSRIQAMAASGSALPHVMLGEQQHAPLLLVSLPQPPPRLKPEMPARGGVGRRAEQPVSCRCLQVQRQLGKQRYLRRQAAFCKAPTSRHRGRTDGGAVAGQRCIPLGRQRLDEFTEAHAAAHHCLLVVGVNLDLQAASAAAGQRSSCTGLKDGPRRLAVGCLQG